MLNLYTDNLWLELTQWHEKNRNCGYSVDIKVNQQTPHHKLANGMSFFSRKLEKILCLGGMYEVKDLYNFVTCHLFFEMNLGIQRRTRGK